MVICPPPDHLIPYAWVVGIHHVSLILEAPGKFPIVEKTSYHGAVNRIQALYQELFMPQFIYGHVLAVHRWCNLDDDINHMSTDSHDDFILIVFNHSLDEGVWDVDDGHITMFRCIDYQCEQHCIGQYHG
jgi:hypothetical protein